MRFSRVLSPEITNYKKVAASNSMKNEDNYIAAELENKDSHELNCFRIGYLRQSIMLLVKSSKGMYVHRLI